MKNISLKLPDDLNAKLERVAKRRGAAKSFVLRDALESYLADGKNGSQLSVAESAADLIGFAILRENKWNVRLTSLLSEHVHSGK
jgi:predicted DNA-binding protein